MAILGSSEINSSEYPGINAYPSKVNSLDRLDIDLSNKSFSKG